MKKTLISILAFSSFALVGCSNENFNSTTEFKTNYEESFIKDSVKRTQSEKKEADNIIHYNISNLNGVFSLCMQGSKHYMVNNNSDTIILIAQDLNENATPCANEGQFQNIFNNLSSGVRIYCSQEKIQYQIITFGNYQFYPMRDLKFRLIPCERK